MWSVYAYTKYSYDEDQNDWSIKFQNHSTIRDLERTFRIFPQIFFYQDHIIGQSGTCQKYRMY